MLCCSLGWFFGCFVVCLCVVPVFLRCLSWLVRCSASMFPVMFLCPYLLMYSILVSWLYFVLLVRCLASLARWLLARSPVSGSQRLYHTTLYCTILYVCMCIRIYIYTHVCIYVYIYVYIVCIYIYIRTYIYIYIYTLYIYIYMYMYTHICVYIYIYLLCIHTSPGLSRVGFSKSLGRRLLGRSVVSVIINNRNSKY